MIPSRWTARQLWQLTALFILALSPIPPVAARLKCGDEFSSPGRPSKVWREGSGARRSVLSQNSAYTTLCNCKFVVRRWDLNHDSSRLRSPGCLRRSVPQKDLWHLLARLCDECRGTAQNSAAVSEHDTEGPSMRMALDGALSPPRKWKWPSGSPRNTWLSTIKDDLAPVNIGLFSAGHKAQDRQGWRKLFHRAMLSWEYGEIMMRQNGIKLCHGIAN